MPSAFFVLLFRPLSLYGWSLVAVRYFFLSISMIVMGFIMVFEWEALFPDRRDYQILTPLPIRFSTLFLAKAAALGIFLGIFLRFSPGSTPFRSSTTVLRTSFSATMISGYLADGNRQIGWRLPSENHRGRGFWPSWERPLTETSRQYRSSRQA